MSFPRRDEHGLHKLSKLFGAILSESMTEAKVSCSASRCLPLTRCCNGESFRTLSAVRHQDVTGFVLSIKNWGCRLSMWVRDVPNDKCRSTGIDRLCKLMRVPALARSSCSVLSTQPLRTPCSGQPRTFPIRA